MQPRWPQTITSLLLTTQNMQSAKSFKSGAETQPEPDPNFEPVFLDFFGEHNRTRFDDKTRLDNSLNLTSSRIFLKPNEDDSPIPIPQSTPKKQKTLAKITPEHKEIEIDTEAENQYKSSGVDLKFAEMLAEENLALSEKRTLIQLGAPLSAFNHFGNGYVQLFTFAKHLIILLGLYMLFIGGYSLYINISSIYCVNIGYIVSSSYYDGANVQSYYSTSSGGTLAYTNDAFSPYGVLSIGTTLQLNPISCYRSWATDLSAASHFPNSLADSVSVEYAGKQTVFEMVAITTFLILLTLGFCLSRSHFLRKSYETGYKPTPCDFTLRMEGLPKTATTEEIKEFFTAQDVDVVEIVKAYDFGDYAQEIKEYNFLKDWVSRRGENFADLATRLEEARKRAKLVDQVFTGVAFITFATRTNTSKMLYRYTRVLHCCLRRDVRQYKGTPGIPRIYAVPSTDDIIWENLTFDHKRRFWRKALGIFVVGLIILIFQAINIAVIWVVATSKLPVGNLQYWSIGLSVVMVLGNLLIEWVIGKSVLLEKYHSKIERATARIERTYICQILNSSILISLFLVYQGLPSGYTGVSLSTLANGVSGLGSSMTVTIQEISYEIFAMFFAGVLIAVFRTCNICASSRRQKIQKRVAQGLRVGIPQQEVNKAFRYPEFELEKAYSNLMTVTIFGLTTSVWAPINLVGCFIYLITLYWIFKKQLTHQCSRPEFAGPQYGLAVFKTIKSGMLLTFIIAAVASAFKFVYANSAVPAVDAIETLGSLKNVVALMYSALGIIYAFVFFFVPIDWPSKMCITDNKSYERYKKAVASPDRYTTLFKHDANSVKNCDPFRNIF